MRKKKDPMAKAVTFIIISIVVVLVVLKMFVGKGGTDEYKKYVKDFGDAVNKYAEQDILEGESFIYTYDELKEILVSKGLLKELKDSGLKITSDSITVFKDNNIVSFYNYKNEKTFENRFELKFEKDNKKFSCTKDDCH